MARKKRVNISIDADIDEQWTKIAKQIGWTKSAMVEDFLREALPYLENITPKNVIPMAIKAIGKKLEHISDLIDEDKKDK